MLCIKHNITDPCFNLASEEYLLKESEKEYFLVYINEPCVIIGKHQNAYAEINHSFVRKNHIKVVRRISGGGAVWHDHGNLNFSFIRNGKGGSLVNFSKYMLPVLDFLNSYGLNVSSDGKNSLVTDGLKISGNAEHVYKNRILHHGTLLFNSDIVSLEEALKSDTTKYSDKAVKSVRSKTINIADQLPVRINISRFGDSLMQSIMTGNSSARMYELTGTETEKINELIKNKYSTWEWNYGYSPPYELNSVTVISGNDFAVNLRIEKGIITKSVISCGLLNRLQLELLEKEFIGMSHREDAILQILKRDEFKDIFNRMNSERWIHLFF
jgi:lipoate-protein ligase A